MLRRCTPALLLILLLAACGGSGPKFTRAQLPRLVLQREDLPGFSRLESAPMTAADLRGGPREREHRFGRRGGWKSRFVPLVGRSRATVTSYVDLFGDARGAKDDLDAYNLQAQDDAVEGFARTVKIPKLGDESALAETISVGPREGIIVAWRYGNVTASIDLETPRGATTVRELVKRARRQERRMKRIGR